MQNIPPRSRQKTNASQLLSKSLIRNFASFDLTGNNINIALAVFSYLFTTAYLLSSLNVKLNF